MIYRYLIDSIGFKWQGLRLPTTIEGADQVPGHAECPEHCPFRGGVYAAGRESDTKPDFGLTDGNCINK